MDYKPHGKTKAMLDWCINRIQSVPYKVTARWLFYRYVEEILKPRGLSTHVAKTQYKPFLQLIGRARKRFYNDWAPNTLTDDTRKAHLRGFGYANEQDWLKQFEEQTCVLDKYAQQENIVEVWFEAEAMYSQFDYHTSPFCITMRPFKGDASIHYKWETAKHLEFLGQYKKPIIILYFGDYDKKGFQIPESAVKDIKQWSQTPFHFIRCGINKDQIEQWNLVESFDKEGTFQWEAVSEDNAMDLIVRSIERYWSLKKIEQTRIKEQQITQRWKELITKALDTIT